MMPKGQRSPSSASGASCAWGQGAQKGSPESNGSLESEGGIGFSPLAWGESEIRKASPAARLPDRRLRGEHPCLQGACLAAALTSPDTSERGNVLTLGPF